MADACVGPAAYRPRRARDSPLYRLAEAHYETFKQVYDDRFASRYGAWRGVVERTLFAFLDCGIEEHGFARVRCEACRREFRVALSRCAWRTVRDLYRVGLRDRHAVPGMVVSIQTYGDLANWQPHLHALVSAGVFNRQRQFTPLPWPPVCCHGDTPASRCTTPSGWSRTTRPASRGSAATWCTRRSRWGG
jgi:hypothetical protein